MRFVGREKELARLEYVLNKPNINTCAVYGRRRCGKTSLLRRFCQGKRNLFFPLIRGSVEQNLTHISREMRRFTGQEKDYPDFESFLDELGAICREERTVVVLDELPYLLSSGDYIASLLQIFIDHTLEDTDSLLIVCGSSISSMDEHLSGGDKPLYRRFLERIYLKPLDFAVCFGMHDNMSDEDKVRTYLTVGGMPPYNEEMSEPTYQQCIENAFLCGSGFLSTEVEAAINEASNSDYAAAILDALSGGPLQIGAVANRTDMKPDTCRRIMKELVRLDLVDVVVPMCGSPLRPRYYIKDSLVAFYYEVVSGNPEIDAYADPSMAYAAIQHDIDTFLGKRFELLCMEYVRKNYICRKIGRCWNEHTGFDDRDGAEVFDGDIDLAAIVSSGSQWNVNMFGECKSTRRKVGFPVLNELIGRVRMLRQDKDNAVFALFSFSGFDTRLLDYAQGSRVLLIGPEEIMGRAPAPTIEGLMSKEQCDTHQRGE